MNTPVFVTSRAAVVDQYRRIAELGCRVVYSRKTNPLIWDTLREETDADVACHSSTTVHDAGAPQRTWYFPRADDEQEIEALASTGVETFVVDNKDDLDTVLDATDDARIAVRMQLEERTTKRGRHYVYGMDRTDALDAVQRLRDAGREHLGLHVHRKTQNIAEWSLTDELGPAVEPVLDQLDCINIGGGIPVSYRNVNDASIEAILERIEEFADWVPDNVDVYAEPGRFIAAPSTVCKTSIIDIEEDTVFVDWSIFNGCMDAALMNYRLPIAEEGSGERYMIKGCSPDSLDVLRYEALLADPSVGDVLTWENAGAYNYVTDFCDLELPEKRVVSSFD